MKNTWFRCVLIVLMATVGTTAHAQLNDIEDIEAVTEEGFFKTYFKGMFKDFTDFGDPFAVNGGIGLNLRSYSAYGGENRQDPFFYSLNANANARLYKLDLPFSILITAKNTESSLPNLEELGDAFGNQVGAQQDRFVRMGFSPHYKWAKLHLGHRAMNFSKFTLANLNFLGVGAELTPGNWEVSGMYGQLAPAVPIDLSLATPNLPVYERFGWGTKLGYNNDQSSLEFILFGAEDLANSVDIPSDSPKQPAPEENLVIGLNGQHLFLERFRLRFEYAMSAISPNKRDALAEKSAYPGFLFEERTTTETYSAIDASLDYEGEAFVAGVQLLRVDPNYRSFGAYFFNNDIVDVLGNLAFGLLDGKANVMLSAGVQSNNLNLLRPATTQRFVYNAAATYADKGFSANANYSNNTSDIGYVLNQELDSLNAVIVTQNAGVTLNYSLSDPGDNQHIFTLSGNIQEVSDDIEDPMFSATTQMLVGNFVYSYVLGGSGWRFSARTNYNQNELAQMQIQRLGFGGGIAKSLLDNKMNIGLDVNYFLNSNDMADNSTNLQGQLRWNYQISESLSANLSGSLLRTQIEDTVEDPFRELIGTLGLQYNFNYNPSQKKEKE